MNQVRVIESPVNPQFKTWKSCLEPKGIKKTGKFLLSGRKLVEEFLASMPDQVAGILGSPKLEGFTVHPRIPTYSLPKKLFAELDTLGTDAPILIVRAPELKAWDPKAALKGTEILLALQDPGNLGAAIRLAEAFSIDRVICLKESAHPLHPKSVKASAGSVLRVELLAGPSVQDISDSTDQLIALDAKGKSLSEFKWPRQFRLVLGEEGRGVPQNIKATSQLISIPMKKTLESLNATSALAIALYSFSLRNNG